MSRHYHFDRRRDRGTAALSVVLLLAMAAGFSRQANAEGLTTIDPRGLVGLLTPGESIEYFRHLERIFPVETIRRSGEVFRFEENQKTLDVSVSFGGTDRSLDDFLDETVTTAFLVVKDDAIIEERYLRGNSESSLATSMSVVKSFTSALVGIALGEGLIGSVDDPITDYVAVLKGSGYEGVPIKHILQMSSGIDFSEVYDDQSSDIMTMVNQLAMGKPIEEYIAELSSARPSGQDFNYASIDTFALSLLVEQVTGKTISQYLEEKIWSELGMEFDATWGKDNHGSVLSFGLLNVTARDYAKFGRLYLNEGNWNGKQIVPEPWVQASVKPDQEYLKLKDFYIEGWDVGYQYQWWVPEGDDGEFTAIGIWGQYIYINPSQNLIIVKNSSDPLFALHELDTIGAFRTIAEALE